jgi:hypothetical protein
MSDFLDELTGEVDRIDGNLSSHEDDLSKWLKQDFLPTEWGLGDGVYDVLGDEFDGPWQASCRLSEWIRPMKCADVLAWYSQQPKAPVFRALPGIDSAGWVRCVIPATPDCTVQVCLDLRVKDFEMLPVHGGFRCP